MFDHELQKAAARYATAKTVETYAALVVMLGGMVFIAIIGIQAIQSIRAMFGF